MDRRETRHYTILIFYIIFSSILIITWFFPYYEVCATGWGIPCDSWSSFTGFSFMIRNFRSYCGIIGTGLIISSIILFFFSKIKVALILTILGNILLGISMYYLSNLTKQIVIPGLYDIYFLFKIKIGYFIGLFAWALMSSMNFLQIIVELESLI